MTKWSVERRWITGGIGLILLLMGTVSYVSYQNATRLIESAKKVRHTNEVLKTLTDVVSTMTDAESGRRGYILFGDEEELERYNAAVRSIDPKITQLRQLLESDVEQQQRLARFVSLITQRLILYRRSSELYRDAQPTSAQAEVIEQLKQNKQEIRQVVNEIQTQEEQLLEIQLVQSQLGFQYRLFIEFLVAFLTFAVILGICILLYRQLVKRQQAEMRQQKLLQDKELSELKLDFFSMVSHEFRTPLSIILGSVQLLDSEGQRPIEPRKLHNNLHRIQSSARLMTKMLTDILTVMRAEAGKLDCKPELVDLEAFCLNLVEDLQLSSESNCIIKLDRQGDCTHADLDEKLLYSILSNLLSNALKYSPNGGEVSFKFHCEPDEVTFEVTDQGIGIPPEDLRALYQPFHRSSNVGKITGSGLGLAVVKRCVDLQQGQIEVKSAIGVGTTFVVKIPQGRQGVDG
jgi:signal transduction histidine kinase